MPVDSRGSSSIEPVLREERELVMSLGGYALELAGGVLVVNERVPVPRFNFVQYVRIHRNRQSPFLERTLDHYFQRALRPSIRVELPVDSFLDTSLRGLGFRPIAEPLSLLLFRGAAHTVPAQSAYEVRAATADEIPSMARFWTGEMESEELVRALTVALEHPNPDEQLVPVISLRRGKAVSAALVHRHRDCVGIHGVVTQPSERGQGAATALVAGALHLPPVHSATDLVAMWSGSSRLDRRLASLGFEVACQYAVYELPPEAVLALPAAGPPGPPRWRPARSRGPSPP